MGDTLPPSLLVGGDVEHLISGVSKAAASLATYLRVVDLQPYGQFADVILFKAVCA